MPYVATFHVQLHYSTASVVADQLRSPTLYTPVLRPRALPTLSRHPSLSPSSLPIAAVFPAFSSSLALVRSTSPSPAIASSSSPVRITANMEQPPPPPSTALPSATLPPSAPPPNPAATNPTPTSAPATAAPVPIPAPMPVPVAPASIPPTQQQQQQHPARPRASTNPGLGALEDESFHAFMLRMDRQGQLFLDRIAPFKLYRWVGLVVLLAIFMLRMFLLEGFYIVTYVLFIFILNQFILFLQPKDRAALVAKAVANAASPEDPEPERPALPTSVDEDEFRPFVRRLPEFKFWYSTTYATVLAFCATFFKVFDVPVFWPLLLFYFVLLFAATMRRQWLDMKRLKYVPWDIGAKKVYRSDPKRVSVTTTRANGPAPAEIVNASGRAPPPVPTVQLQPKRPQSPDVDLR